MAEQGGLPQLDFSSFPNQLFWLVVFIVVLFVIVNGVVLPRIGGIIDQRERQVRDDLEEAGRLDEQATRLNQETSEQLAQAKADADAIVAEARVKARKMQDEAVARAAEMIAARSDEAGARIEEIRNSARESVREIGTAVAAEIVIKMLPGRDAGSRVVEAVNSRLNGVRN